MPHPVFISYARDASREHARALYNALGGEQGGLCFLDTEDIALGDRFPERLVDALFDARVVVIFAEPLYFSRWYCLLEFRIARTPFLRVAEQAGSTAAERNEALQGIVVAMPPRGTDPMMDRFPALVRATNWPSVQEAGKLAELVLARLATNPPTLRERYEALDNADAARSLLLQATRLPHPQRIGSIPFAPAVGLPESIRDSFVGRADDLWRIFDVLTTERGPRGNAAGLTGSLEAQGGFGKTRLALEFLYRFGPRYFPGGLFWVNAEQDPEIQQYEVLVALQPNTPRIEVFREYPGGVGAALARALRELQPEKPALLIIDNVPEPGPGADPRPLSDWCPAPSEVAILATSRTRVSLGAGGSVVPLEIDVLDPASAVDLLANGSQRNDLAPAEWSEIAEWVGRLPLALELLNRAIAAAAVQAGDVLGARRLLKKS